MDAVVVARPSPVVAWADVAGVPKDKPVAGALVVAPNEKPVCAGWVGCVVVVLGAPKLRVGADVAAAVVVAPKEKPVEAGAARPRVGACVGWVG